MTDLGMTALVGQTVTAAWINEERDLVVLDTTSGRRLYLTWVGDCCAHCFLANVSGADALIGAEVVEVESAEWVVEREGEFDVVESMGTKIRTTRGYVTFESRLEHNGYYGGEIMVSDTSPMDQYHEHRYRADDLPGLKPLTDF